MCTDGYPLAQAPASHTWSCCLPSLSSPSGVQQKHGATNHTILRLIIAEPRGLTQLLQLIKLNCDYVWLIMSKYGFRLDTSILPARD